MSPHARVSLADVEVGYLYPHFSVDFSDGAVRAYVDVLEGTPLRDEAGRELVPLGGVATLTLGALLDRSLLPPGAVHAGQETEMHGPIAIGSPVTCKASISGRSSRADVTFLTLEYILESPAGALLMAGKATLLIAQGNAS